MTHSGERSWLLEQLRDRDVLCPKCQYNLRGSATERCPECGKAFDRRVLNQPQKLRLGPWFWIGVVIDFTATIVIVGHLTHHPALWVLWGLLSVVFTGFFVLLTFMRQYRHSPDEFAAELAWAVWIPLFFKLTCLTGMLLSAK